MLKFIECDWFLEKRITFHEKLNIVVGDRINSNSIGKSTLLKVVDFIYGGDTLITHGKDVAGRLGHHSYKFSLILDRQYFFERNTGEPAVIIYNDTVAGQVYRWALSDYLGFLHHHYTPEITELSFRSIVSPVSRIWGRDNLNVAKPLHSFVGEKGSQCIDYLIKIFNLYGTLSDLSIRLENLTKEKNALNSAFLKNIVPKINKSTYTANLSKIEDGRSKLNEIREQLALIAISINELVDEKVLEQKIQKNSLLELRSSLASEIERLKSNLESNRAITRKNFAPLLEIIPNINLDKLERIEDFHNSLGKILNKEIKEKELELSAQLSSIDSAIQDCNQVIARALAGTGNPAYIVDSVMDISLEVSRLSKENELYEKANNLKSSIASIRSALTEKKLIILAGIQRSLNNDISGLVKFIYNESRVSPQLTLLPESYSYDIPQDTGTGKAYSNLILLDTSLLRHTKIPFLIHDSLLFKNVENRAIENILRVYLSLNQQAFVALDGDIVDSVTAQELVKTSAVIHLSANKLLYTQDWRSTAPQVEITS